MKQAGACRAVPWRPEGADGLPPAEQEALALD